MTMPHPHPDDERLAAYAGGDSDALADPSLVAHLTACDRCRPLVEELSLLRDALAELPDLAPSRPLRLIPPVPTAPATSPRDSWLRRLTAPAMAAGAGLVLVGAIGVGATGAIGGFFGQAASEIFANVGDNLQGAGASHREGVPAAGADSPTLAPEDTTGSVGYERSTPPRTVTSSPQSAPQASYDDGKVDELNAESSPEQPWLILLIAGAGLFVIAAALRVSISPRAG
jgi:hypothetical protein